MTVTNQVLEEVKEALKAYSIEVLGIKTESYKGKKGVWWIRTPEGNKILKKEAYPEKTLRFIIAAMEYLMEHGVYIPKIIKTREDCNYTVINETCYMLSEAINGSTLDYYTSDHIKRVVQELAKFHKASIGFKAPKTCKVRTHLGGWVDKYQQQAEKIKDFYEQECSNKDHSTFGKIILNEFPYFYDRVQKAIEETAQDAYHQWVNAVSNEGGLCHQDFTAGNLLLDKKNRIYVLDTDSLTFDIPLRDIRKLLNKIIKRKGEWEYSLVKDILMWYQEKNPLENWQWQLLRPTLTYPHLFVGIMRKYYEKREKSWTESKYIKRLKEMIKIEKSVDPIVSNMDSLLPAQELKK